VISSQVLNKGERGPLSHSLVTFDTTELSTIFRDKTPIDEGKEYVNDYQRRILFIIMTLRILFDV
jgi:hypothetical protein